MKIKIICLVLIFTILLFKGNIIANQNYSLEEVKIISRSQSNYLSPENTYFSIHSCTITKNMEWCDETMTKYSLDQYIKKFRESGIDRKKVFELAENIKKSYIVDKFEFKNSTVLLVEDHTHHGSIIVMPLPFVKEDGLWKLTNKYAGDEELNSYLYYIPPLFDGKGGRTMDVNTFLGYKNPNQAQTQLDLGETSYTVHVYYGRTIDPSTFTAELNRQDVSEWFSPQPFSNEEVELPLQKGRNTLVLSVEGTRNDGKRAKDTDRLVFIVP